MATTIEPHTATANDCEKAAAHRSVMSTMDEHGDTKITWDSDNADEVAAAKAQFELLVGKKGFKAFAVKRGGEAGDQITRFDPEAERIILVPQIAGG